MKVQNRELAGPEETRRELQSMKVKEEDEKDEKTVFLFLVTEGWAGGDNT